MIDQAARSAIGDTRISDDTSTTCVAALDSIVRLSRMSAATYGAAAQLRELAELCSEASRTIADIRSELDGTDMDQDPARLLAALEKLNTMSAAVRAATASADETILRLSAAGP